MMCSAENASQILALYIVSFVIIVIIIVVIIYGLLVPWGWLLHLFRFTPSQLP